MPPFTIVPGEGEMDMSAGSVVSAEAKAAQACVPCRKQKRKCDKGLPACGLCSRMGRICDYTDVQQAPTADDLIAMQMKIAELEQRLNQKAPEIAGSYASPNGHTPSSSETLGPSASLLRAMGESPPPWIPAQNTFPSAMFLDIDCFVYASISIPKPAAEIPMDVLEILSNANTLQQAVSDYFNTIHCWFPIISKKRMNMGQPLYQGGSDLAMLFLSMKLVCSQPVNGVASADNHLYVASKRFIALLESRGTVSILYLQAMILVAIYELGHSIYPAAWMTIGACSRYAEILGLPSYKDTKVILGPVSTWTELEERRRVWWGVFILDRVVCLGNRRKPVTCAPSPNDILPMDDRAWDEGDVANALQSSVSAPLTERQGPFARLCQAAILIDRVQCHVRTTIKRHRAHEPEPFSPQEVSALVDDLTTFSTLVSSELAGAGARATCSGTSSIPPPSIPSPSHQHIQSTSAFTFSSPIDTANPTTVQSPSTPSSFSSHHLPQSTTTTSQNHIPSLLPPHFLAFSALIALYDLYCCPEEIVNAGGPAASSASDVPKTAASLQMQLRAVTGIRGAALSVRDAGVELLLEFAMLPKNLARVSPLVLDGLYAAMATLHWLWEECGEAELGRALGDVERVLARLDMRWRLARDYLGLGKYHDVTHGAGK